MIVDLDTLPDPEQDLAAAAEIYLAMASYRSWQARAIKVLGAHTKEKGSIETMAGTLTREFDGFDYVPQIADEMPQLGRNHFSFSLPLEHKGSVIDAHRPLEILLESMPELSDQIRLNWKVTTKVDGVKASELAKDKSSPMGQRVRELRKENTKLGVGE